MKRKSKNAECAWNWIICVCVFQLVFLCEQIQESVCEFVLFCAWKNMDVSMFVVEQMCVNMFMCVCG